MSKKILISLMAILLAVGLVGAGAFAYFSDTETSTGNTFTAGTLDLTYNVDATLASPQATVVVTGAGAGADSNGVDSQVTFANLAPGDSGTIVWTITNTGTLPGTLNVIATRSNDSDGIDTEPELLEEAGGGVGELDDNMPIYGSYSLDGLIYNSFSGITMATIPTTGMVVDSFPKTLPAGSVLTIVLNWSIPTTVTNIIQGDTFTLGLQMTLDQ